MIKKVEEVKSKEGEDVSPHINKLLKDFAADRDIRETASLTPSVGLTEDGRKYALWLGKNVAIFVVRKSKDRVVVGLLKSRTFSEIINELRNYGITIQGFSGLTEPIWNDLRACLYAALTVEQTDEKERSEEPEEPEEQEQEERSERSEGPEIPLEFEDIEAEDESSAGYLKAAKAIERNTSKGAIRREGGIIKENNEEKNEGLEL